MPAEVEQAVELLEVCDPADERAEADPWLVDDEGVGATAQDDAGRVRRRRRGTSEPHDVTVRARDGGRHAVAGAESSGHCQGYVADDLSDRAGVLQEVGLAGPSRVGSGPHHGRRLIAAAADLDEVQAFACQ